MSEADPKPTRGRPKTMNAEQVLDVAMTAYWQSDPADVSVNAICHSQRSTAMPNRCCQRCS
jgi:TetR/AcrR family transcriptional regulator, copper-responsive repressor